MYPDLTDQFLLYELPKCVLFARGKMYVYNGPQDYEGFFYFATEDYEKV